MPSPCRTWKRDGAEKAKENQTSRSATAGPERVALRRRKCDTLVSIGKRLRRWREYLGLTQAQFAARAGLSKATLVGYEIGQRKPGAEALALIARTGVNLTWLLTGEGEMSSIAHGSQEEQRKQDLTSLIPSNHPRRERWAKLIELVEQEPDPDRREALLTDLISRAQEAAEMNELRRALQQLLKARC